MHLSKLIRFPTKVTLTEMFCKEVLMELMKNMVTHAAESTTARPLLGLVEAIGLFLIDAGEGPPRPRGLPVRLVYWSVGFATPDSSDQSSTPLFLR